MVKKTITACDVLGCREEATHSADCCPEIVNGTPSPSKRFDLCELHYSKWCKKTCRLLRRLNKKDDTDDDEEETEESETKK